MGRKKKWRVRQTSCSKGSFSLRIRYLMSCLQGWLSMFSSCSQGRTLTELCEASREQHGSGCDKLLRKRAANTLLACLDKSESTGAIPAALATTEEVKMEVFCLRLHKGCVHLPGVSHCGPQFAIPGGDTHLCPKGGWRLGNVHKSLCLRRYPVLWWPRRSRNSQ